MKAVYKLGERGLSVPMQIHQENRSRLCERLRNLWKTSKAPHKSLDGVFVLLQGGTGVMHGGSDVEIVFRQESYFHWAFGGLEPDWYGAIEVSTGRAILFVPEIPENAAVYMGEPMTLSDIKSRYAVDDVHYSESVGFHRRSFIFLSY